MADRSRGLFQNKLAEESLMPSHHLKPTAPKMSSGAYYFIIASSCAMSTSYFQPFLAEETVSNCLLLIKRPTVFSRPTTPFPFPLLPPLSLPL